MPGGWALACLVFAKPFLGVLALSALVAPVVVVVVAVTEPMPGLLRWVAPVVLYLWFVAGNSIWMRVELKRWLTNHPLVGE